MVWDMVHHRIARDEDSRAPVCRDVVDSHAGSFGGYVAGLGYRVDYTSPQSSPGTGFEVS